MKIGNLNGRGVESRTFQPDPSLPLPSCSMGVEVEVENCSPRFREIIHSGIWITAEEGMLRNNGREFVFAQPLFGKDMVDAIQFLDNKIEEHRQNRESYIFSHRTSVHVHIDVRDMEPGQLFSMLMYYIVFERPMFNWLYRQSGVDRSESPFCVPYFNSPDDYIGLFNNLFRLQQYDDPDMQMELFHNFARQGQRYSAVNFSSTNNLGTLEFRQMHGTSDSTEILTWVKMIQTLKLRGMEMPNPEPDEMIQAISAHGPENFTRQFFGDELAEELLSVSNHNEIFQGVRRAQDMVHYFSMQELQNPLLRQVVGTEMFLRGLSNQLKRGE